MRFCTVPAGMASNAEKCPVLGSSSPNPEISLKPKRKGPKFEHALTSEISKCRSISSCQSAEKTFRTAHALSVNSHPKSGNIDKEKGALSPS